MPTPYTSIFDGPSLITKKQLCEILNLDVTRPALLFTPAEIQSAYRKRALRFHPDAQLRQETPIPDYVCNVLMNDIERARYHLLRNEDNIPGKAFLENAQNAFSNDPHAWVDAAIVALKTIQTNSDLLSSFIPWISRFSNNVSTILLMSTFSYGELNFRFLHHFAGPLNFVRPFISTLDGTLIENFLRLTHDLLNTQSPLADPAIVAQLKALLPNEVTEQKFNELIAALLETSGVLKNILTDDFIANTKHIVRFWAHFAATVPTWKHIFGVYFVSLLFMSSSLPKFVNANKTIAQVIWTHKGVATFVFVSLPLLVMTCVLLPINLALQLGTELAWIAIKASFQLVRHGIQLLSAAFKTLFSLFNDHFGENAFDLFESTINLTIRLAFNTSIEILDALIIILSDRSILSSFQSAFNAGLDSMLNRLRPKAINQEEPKGPLAPAAANQDDASIEPPVPQALSFFAPPPAENAEDRWLDGLLASLAVDQAPVEDKAANRI